MIRKMSTASYTDDRLSVKHNLDVSQELTAQSSLSKRGAIDASEISDAISDAITKEGTSLQSNGEEEASIGTLSKLSQMARKKSFDSNMALNAQQQNETMHADLSSLSSSHETHATTSSSRQEDLSTSPKAPGLLAPAVDPSVGTEVTGTPPQNEVIRSDRKNANGYAADDDKDKQPRKNQKNKAEDDGRNDKDTNEDDSEATGDDTTENISEADDDVIADSIDEEEGGQGPVITLPRKGSGKSSDEDSDEDSDESDDQEEDDDSTENVAD